jgi:hypothetical protein
MRLHPDPNQIVRLQHLNRLLLRQPHSGSFRSPLL